MGSVLVGLIFLVGLVVVVGLILNAVLGVANAGKRAVTGAVMRNSPVRGEWRGLPIPVPAKEVQDATDLPVDPPPPPGHHAFLVMPGSHLAAAVQWFHDAWTQAGCIEDNFQGSSTNAVLTFRNPSTGRTVMAACQQRYSPRRLVAVILSDLREED